MLHGIVKNDRVLHWWLVEMRMWGAIPNEADCLMEGQEKDNQIL